MNCKSTGPYIVVWYTIYYLIRYMIYYLINVFLYVFNNPLSGSNSVFPDCVTKSYTQAKFTDVFNI